VAAVPGEPVVIAALRRAARADPWFTAAFVALAVAAIVPIWIGRYLPFLDLPNHLSAISIWHYYDDPRFDFAKYYTLNLKPLPYWAHYYSVHLLAYLFGVELANKVFLTVYALALPTGALAFARRFGRSPWVALFAFPLVWNFNLAEGFIAYCAGFAAMVFALVLVDRHCERPTWRSALAVVAVGSSIYFFHLLTYVLFLVSAGLLVYTHPAPLKPMRILERGVPVVLCALVGLWAYERSRTMGFGSFGSGKPEFVFEPLDASLARAPARLLNFLTASRDEWAVIGLAVGWLALAATAARAAPTDAPGERRRGPEVCFFVAAAAAVLLPKSMSRPFNWYMINGRFVPVAALFGAMLLGGRVEGWRRWLFVPVVASGLFYCAAVAHSIVVFNRRVAGFDELVAQIPLHKSTLTLSLPPLYDDQYNFNSFNQWASYTQIRRGGYNFYNFNYGFPLRYKTFLPAPPWNHPESFNWDLHARGWDYFVTHNEGIKYDLFRPLEKAGRVRLVDARGPWKLWQKIVADPPTPPPMSPLDRMRERID
jgi:hypothetical protein